MLSTLSHLLAVSLLLFEALAVRALPNEARNLHERALHNVTAQNKAGLGWNNPPDISMRPFFRTSKIGWHYTWSSWPNGQASNLDFVPLLWGPEDIDTWTTAVTTRLKPMFQSKAITSVLGFNEPQEVGQSNMTVAEALPLWMEHLQPLKTQYGVRLGTPATSSAPSGKNWTSDFLAACRNQTGCSVDFVALHYYGTNATTMINYITDFHETFQLPIWVTEWACQDFTPEDEQCDQEHTSLYMNITQTFMESTDWVERYSWFGALVDNPVTPTNDLLTNSGNITALGQQYIQETPEQIAEGEYFSPFGIIHFISLSCPRPSPGPRIDTNIILRTHPHRRHLPHLNGYLYRVKW
ncbi:glycoside hydrolase family 128 protein [Serendipita vermifera MAFF 305830]|uniref:Glycoside hydrolase family 128 protein n=1 Tax=Serendipita vermifera MAFF 305830 TaxID=933852 RepID=A0A0C3B307_SERVB|nr:glycoside hydrolase family 128 protein [Serendipita vermifera MAFF 305830]